MQSVSLIVFPVKDVEAAKKIYTAFLGAEPYADSPYYVGYKMGEQEIGLDPNGFSYGMTGPISYAQVGDIKASLQALLEAGAQLHQDTRDVGGGRLVAQVRDADGNFIGLMQNS